MDLAFHELRLRRESVDVSWLLCSSLFHLVDVLCCLLPHLLCPDLVRARHGPFARVTSFRCRSSVSCVFFVVTLVGRTLGVGFAIFVFQSLPCRFDQGFRPLLCRNFFLLAFPMSVISSVLHSSHVWLDAWFSSHP